MKKRKKKSFISIKWVIAFVILAAFLLFLAYKPWHREERKSEKVETVNRPEPAPEHVEPVENHVSHVDTDPFKLSFKASSLMFASDLRNRLSGSELEYCSKAIEKDGSNDLVLTWNLKSNDEEVYRCIYSFDKNRKYAEQSIVACSIGEAYDQYVKGDKKLSRDYIMPTKDDRIDMFVYENSSDYYDKYFILGKYSDMYCYIKGNDIYFEYYWYQRSDDGPILVYKSTATDTTTTSGRRYRDDIWDLYEDSYWNIDIIPYDEYPRSYDYYEVYRQWKRNDTEKKNEERLKEKMELYCSFDDEEDLYYEYQDDFDSYEDADYFYHEYCE